METAENARKTRLAPSPTGSLHLGNARTFLVNWALARQRGWKIVLRIDDLDSPRVRPGADQSAIEVLRWLGLDWDEGPVYQTSTLASYQQHLSRLAEIGAIYPCRHTRSQIAAASLSAPHADEHELRFPETLRPDLSAPFQFDAAGQAGAAWRFLAPDRSVEFHDEVAGPQSWNVQQHVGDFLVTNKQGLASYQLACVVDDDLAGVTDVVRGDDLLSSAPRQMLLQESLGFHNVRYWHLPIVVGPDGQRLAKRHGGHTIEQYRNAGVSADRIRGLLAEWSGNGATESCTPCQFLESFAIERLPRERIVFDTAMHNRLMEQP